MTSKDKRQEFIRGLTKLSRETGITIEGCGCCGSPYLYADHDTSKPGSGYAFKCVDDQLGWIDPDDSYDWEQYGDKVLDRA